MILLVEVLKGGEEAARDSVLLVKCNGTLLFMKISE